MKPETVIAPGTHDITIHQGATFSLELQYRDATGTGVDRTGYRVEGKVANRLNTAEVATFVLSWIDQTTGSFKLKIDAADTALLTSEGQYDVLITEPGGDKYYILQGRAFLDPGITGV